MLAMNIVFAVTFIPVGIILYFMIRNLAKPKKNIILGVTLPYSVHDDAETTKICASFQKMLNAVMLPLIFLSAAPFFMRSMGAAMTWYMTWMVLVIVAPYAVFGVHRGKLMSLKLDKGWRGEAAGLGLVDLRASADPPGKVNAIWFLLPLILSLLPLIDLARAPSEWLSIIMYATFSLMVALFWFIYYRIFHVRSEVFNEDLTLTRALTRVRRYNWSKFWLISAWLTGVFNVLIWFFSDDMLAFLFVTLGYSLILLGAAIKIEFSTRSAQQKLTAGDARNLYADEDDFWIWGILYHNPNDNHFLVNYRIGIGMTCNMAKLSGKILMGFAALTIIITPFTGIWMWMEEATPVRLVMTQTELTARHTRDQYVIPLDSIESVELIDKLPVIISRVAGTSMENMSKGLFSTVGYGRVRLNVQTKDPPFLQITAGGETYFLNDNDSEVTLEVFLQLQSSIQITGVNPPSP